MSTLLQSKASLRKLALSRRNALSEGKRVEKSNAICRQFVKRCQACFYKRPVRAVALYDAINSEVDLSPLANKLQQEGVTVLKPLMSDTEGHMEFVNWDEKVDPLSTTESLAINVPTVPPEEIGIIVCPVVAFDKRNNRLGYGGGYYDRYLPRLMSDTMKIGVAFSCQEVDEVPTEEFDVPLDMVLTENS